VTKALIYCSADEVGLLQERRRESVNARQQDLDAHNPNRLAEQLEWASLSAYQTKVPDGATQR
jgi:hypothetical protein